MRGLGTFAVLCRALCSLTSNPWFDEFLDAAVLSCAMDSAAVLADRMLPSARYATEDSLSHSRNGISPKSGAVIWLSAGILAGG